MADSSDIVEPIYPRDPELASVVYFPRILLDDIGILSDAIRKFETKYTKARVKVSLYGPVGKKPGKASYDFEDVSQRNYFVEQITSALMERRSSLEYKILKSKDDPHKIPMM